MPRKLTTSEFIEKAKKIHGEKYDYSQVNYINNDIKVVIICKNHKSFLQTPNAHLNSRGCPKCADTRLTTSNFIYRANKIHSDKYDYSKVNYITALEKVKLICKKHGEFLQTPAHHLTGDGCPKCGSNISKLEIEFLNYLKIPDTVENRQKKISNLKVDGIDYSTNTIYEFLGDFYHGNPEKFNPDNYNKICHKTFKELYENTFNKLNKLKELGYNVKYIWENDWYKFKKEKTPTPNIYFL